MIKYISNGNQESIYVRPDEEHVVEHYSADKVWTSQQFNSIMNSCVGPNTVNLAVDTVLEPSEMKSLLKFFLGPDSIL